MSDVLSRYSPRWLYLNEFMDALPGSDIAEKEAVLLLIRDRLIVGGSIDENSFRFLAGKPQIENASWLANLSDADIAWDNSCIRAEPALPDDSLGRHLSSSGWYLIEIAADGLNLFRSGKNQKIAQPQRTPPEQTRALGVMKALFDSKIPAKDQPTNTDLVRKVQDEMERQGVRTVSKETILRAAGREDVRRAKRK